MDKITKLPLSTPSPPLQGPTSLDRENQPSQDNINQVALGIISAQQPLSIEEQPLETPTQQKKEDKPPQQPSHLELLVALNYHAGNNDTTKINELIEREFYQISISSEQWRWTLQSILQNRSSKPEIIQLLLPHANYNEWHDDYWITLLNAASSDDQKIKVIIESESFKSYNFFDFSHFFSKIASCTPVLKALLTDDKFSPKITHMNIANALTSTRKLASVSLLLTYSIRNSYFNKIPPSALNQPLIVALWHNDKEIAKTIYDCEQFHCLSYSTVYKACLIAGGNGYWQIIKHIFSSRKVWILFTLIPFLGIITWVCGKIKNYFLRKISEHPHHPSSPSSAPNPQSSPLKNDPPPLDVDP